VKKARETKDTQRWRYEINITHKAAAASKLSGEYIRHWNGWYVVCFTFAYRNTPKQSTIPDRWFSTPDLLSWFNEMLHANMNIYGNAAVIKGDNHLKYAKEIITNGCINFLSRETDNKMTRVL
jgi:hypothetical protein